MRKPPNIVYGVEDTPPPLVLLLSGLQQVGLLCLFLIFPLLVTREAGLPPENVLDVLRMSMVAMALGALLQASRRGPVGSGFLCPPVFTAAYVGPSVLAAKAGGLPLVLGMTVFAGAVEAALSRALRNLRPLFPPEVAGFVVLMLGATIGGIGVRYLVDLAEAAQAVGRDHVVFLISLGIMVGLNIWTKGFPRLFSALVGMGMGFGAAILVGGMPSGDLHALGETPWVALPSLRHLGWSFDVDLAVPFIVGALAASLKAMGNIVTCQKINDARWLRPDIRSISGGVLADGLGTMTAGLLGTVGINSSPSSVGLAGATGVTSRRVTGAIAGILLLLAFLPKVGELFVIMPKAVMAAALLFTASFVFVNGLQIIATRMLDARRTFVIGLSFLIGMAVDLHPGFFAHLPAAIQPFVGSSIVLGTLSALLLNLIFRLGVRQRQTLVVDGDNLYSRKIEDFIEEQGAIWGARRDVIDRASFNLQQSIETIVDGCEPRGPLEIEASFDEFNLDLQVSYVGPPLELPEVRPSNEEIMASEEGQRRLAGYMLRRHADRVQSSHKAGRSTILFHFDH